MCVYVLLLFVLNGANGRISRYFLPYLKLLCNFVPSLYFSWSEVKKYKQFGQCQHDFRKEQTETYHWYSYYKMDFQFEQMTQAFRLKFKWTHTFFFFFLNLEVHNMENSKTVQKGINMFPEAYRSSVIWLWYVIYSMLLFCVISEETTKKKRRERTQIYINKKNQYKKQLLAWPCNV